MMHVSALLPGSANGKKDKSRNCNYYARIFLRASFGLCALCLKAHFDCVPEFFGSRLLLFHMCFERNILVEGRSFGQGCLMQTFDFFGL
jgi:hypothetical protein